jgi:hypothetical protein
MPAIIARSGARGLARRSSHSLTEVAPRLSSSPQPSPETFDELEVALDDPLNRDAAHWLSGDTAKAPL